MFYLQKRKIHNYSAPTTCQMLLQQSWERHLSVLVRLTYPVLHGKARIPAGMWAHVCVLTKPVLSSHYPIQLPPPPSPGSFLRVDRVCTHNWWMFIFSLAPQHLWGYHLLLCWGGCHTIFKKLIIYLAVLGLHCCMQAFSSCSEQGLLFVAVHGL